MKGLRATVRRTTARPAFVAVVLALVSVFTARLAAHPAATTTVTIAARGTAIDVTLIADAEALIAKLDALSGAPLSDDATPTASTRAARLVSRQSTLLRHVDVACDGVPVSVAWAGATVSDDQRATIRLIGRVPAGARSVTWRTSLVFGSYPLAVHRDRRDDDIEWLQGASWSQPVALASNTTTWHTVVMALGLGFMHILPNGFDHILFVLGLYFLSTRARQVLAQVSAFTLAHSITLGLTLYGVIALPSRVIEPLIALSVAYVGIENLVTAKLKPWRIVVVFGFGLLHGMGFAEALANLHLARPQFLTTLIGFNVGVEGGQLAVIVVAASAMAVATRARTEWRRPTARLASAGIGVIGLLWTIQRVL